VGFTGWCRFWQDPSAYRNPDAHGQMHFPAFSEKSAELLLEREIAGIAIDTLSPDCLDQSFPVHRHILGAGKYIIENLADCSKVPAKGAYALALPIKAEDATEAPMRIVALF
jgi:kynurenine formamidase